MKNPPTAVPHTPMRTARARVSVVAPRRVARRHSRAMHLVASSSKPDSSASRVVGEETIHAERWLKLTRVDYVDPTGARRQWDAVRRTTTKHDAEADAVCVFATLRGGDATSEGGDVVLVRQFRPACGGETVELPAGLIDAGETAETSALRELREECGYVGEVTGKTPAVVLSPGLSDERVVMVSVDVDLDAEANRDATQQLEGSEFITVIRCPKRELLETLNAFDASGVRVFAGLYMLAWADAAARR